MNLLIVVSLNPGRTPLHYAAQECHFELCRLMLTNLEDKTPTDNFGFTPKDLTREQNHVEILKLF